MTRCLRGDDIPITDLCSCPHLHVTDISNSHIPIGVRVPELRELIADSYPPSFHFPIRFVFLIHLPLFWHHANHNANLRIRILKGNLAPGGAVAKITGKEGLGFTGKARTFDSEDDFVKAVESGSIKKGEKTVVILRYLGPKGGPG